MVVGAQGNGVVIAKALFALDNVMDINLRILVAQLAAAHAAKILQSLVSAQNGSGFSTNGFLGTVTE